VHVVDSVDQLTMIAAQYATGAIPARPFLLIGQQSMTDPSRQPEGKETAWAYTHVPQVVRSDAGGDLSGAWDESETEQFAKRMEDEVERLAPGFRSLIRGRFIRSPRGFEAANANLPSGALGGGTAQLHQQLVFRPIPGLGRPETPVRALYLGSASAHPGGGVHGAPGANAARAAIAGQRLRRLRLR
jgi:phytoene dehydrogenase-like protein